MSAPDLKFAKFLCFWISNGYHKVCYTSSEVSPFRPNKAVSSFQILLASAACWSCASFAVEVWSLVLSSQSRVSEWCCWRLARAYQASVSTPVSLRLLATCKSTVSVPVFTKDQPSHFYHVHAYMWHHFLAISVIQKPVEFSWNSLFNFEDVQLLRLRDFFKLTQWRFQVFAAVKIKS